MDPFEYVVVITSLITGLGIAQILTNISDVVANHTHVKLSLNLTLMVVKTFANLMQEWWYNYQYASQVQSWTMLISLSLVIYPIFQYMLARMLFPPGLRTERVDLVQYYWEQWQKIFSVTTIIIAISIFHDVYISELAWHTQALKMLTITITWIFILFNVTNKAAHAAFHIISTIGIITFIVLSDTPLVPYEN